MAKRRVVVALQGEDYDRLERWSEQDDRTADQQAAYLLRQLLAKRFRYEQVPQESVPA
jgi:hypothetical protein